MNIKQLLPETIKPKVRKDQKHRLNELIEAFCKIVDIESDSLANDTVFSDTKYKYKTENRDKSRDKDRDIRYLDYATNLSLTTDDANILCTIIQSKKIYNSYKKFAAYSHACCALADTKDVTVLPNLVNQLHNVENHDEHWSIELLSSLMANFGEPAVAMLMTAQSNAPRKSEFVKSSINDALCLIFKQAEKSSDNSDAKVIALKQKLGEFLHKELKNHEQNGRYYNASIIGHMLEFKQTEYLSTIQAAFAADSVDPTVFGDIESVEIELGVRTERETVQKSFMQLFKEEQRRHEKDAFMSAANEKGLTERDDIDLEDGFKRYMSQLQKESMQMNPLKQAMGDLKG